MRTFFLISTLVATTLALPAETPGQGQPSIGAQRLAGPRTGPAPRLPDGTVDLSGVWVGGGPINDIEREGGLKPGDARLAAAALGEGAHGHQRRHDGAAQPLSPDGRAAHDAVSVPNRADADAQGRDAHLHPARGQHPQLPAGVHGRPQAPAGSRPDLVRSLDRVVGEGHAGHRHRRLQRQVLVRPPRALRTPSSCTPSSDGRAWISVAWRTRSPSTTPARSRSRSR